jgi:hypothetical protein
VFVVVDDVLETAFPPFECCREFAPRDVFRGASGIG